MCTTHNLQGSQGRLLQSTAITVVVALIIGSVAGCTPKPMKVRQTVDDSALETVESLTSQVFDEFVVKSLPGEDFSYYRNLMFTPVTLRVTENKWRKLTEKDKRRLFTDFQRAYRGVFDEVELTNNPDAHTLIVHTYVTELRPSDPERNFVPFIIGELDLGAAVFETEALNNTGRLVAVARGVYNGRPLIEGYSTWDVVRHAVRAWLASCKELLQQGKIIQS